ncbi:hypothetical protein GO495_02190 [Chitinophaga oryziterrae]|uniref:Uncharacterized protein n=1 Tax=Chitinophaga oryziterrae TaxID=1031224 RepID=A0A6N8J2W8_9BACT|nr:hypothetical protein [Chitinophaga oryziterrae]MVT39383.1 hypothetical protein [Chitinophaga oryziterrae]
MEYLEQQQILTLGKLIVKQLDADDDNDMLSRWMAHYLAEKMTLLESVTTVEHREALRKECFELILNLWEQRWHYPEGKQPLRNFDHILAVLERLEPDASQPFYSIYFDVDWVSKKLQEPEEDEGQKYANAITAVDKGPKACIKQLSHRAAQLVDDEHTRQFLNASETIPDSVDIQVLQMLAGDPEEQDSQQREGAYSRYEIERLKRDIGLMEGLAKVNEQLLQDLKQQLSSFYK